MQWAQGLGISQFRGQIVIGCDVRSLAVNLFGDALNTRTGIPRLRILVIAPKIAARIFPSLRVRV